MKKNYSLSGKKRQHPKELRRGIYILPNLFTTCSLFCGFYSIIAAFNGDFMKAAWAIMLAGVFDWLDGKIARLSHSISRFGMEYDSLSDLIAFGIAPALMIYTWALIPFGRIGWLASFLYVACAALRLARFNVQSNTIETKYFQGMPTPAAGGLIATTIILSDYLGWNEASKHFPILLMTFFLSIMMVSKVRYQSLKQLELSGKISFQLLVITLCIIIIVAAEPQITLFALFSLYAFSGPFIALKDKLGTIRKEALQF
ncbi:MAG: CDP-diacylglycerol--serine O-phosphatidyltransferase [Deltaproteobacteria bacterium]|nr:CDP-diacylglycerol--serine O-phosphatidyltransferase [Deltaproteobacteria bacterium]